MRRLDVRRIVLAVAAPVIAIAFALLVTALVLVATGDPVWATVQQVWDYGTERRVLAQTLNQGTVYYLSALAVAVGFRMNLFNIGVDGQYRLAASLSGGNQQKFIVGREMCGEPKVLIASHPTRGGDVGAQAAIWDHIREARRNGLGVLLISADLDELIGLSDSIKVILRGRFVADVDPSTVTPEDLGAAMTGAGEKQS